MTSRGLPDRAALMEAFEATWPAAEIAAQGVIRTGRGLGAGGRVSSSRAAGPDWTEGDLEAAEAQHRAWDQPPLFRVPEDDARLIAALEGRGYRLDQPTAIMAVPVSVLTRQPVPSMAVFTLWPPLAIQREIWAAGSITPARQAVMARVPGSKTSLLGRIDDRAAGAGFAALHGSVAMIHAIEVLPGFRRRGLGEMLVRKAAHWAAGQGAAHLGLAVTLGNDKAVSLYHRLGFTEAARYGYYRQPVQG